LSYFLKELSLAIFFFAASLGANGENPNTTLNTIAAREHVVFTAGQHFTHATWYAGKCVGRRLAGGKRYDWNASFVATNEHYPFGTKLRVTNIHNHRTIVVSVEDREPYHPGRTLDLSYAAAKQLDMIRTGVVLVSYSTLPSSSSEGDPIQ
jgi:rare lipoprotein A (peptidoglycan hydrolase)